MRLPYLKYVLELLHEDVVVSMQQMSSSTISNKTEQDRGHGFTLRDPLIALKIGTHLIVHSNTHSPIMQNLFNLGAPGVIETSSFKIFD
jgi:hypothetical protein